MQSSEIIDKIQQNRRNRGFSYENMADDLNISAPAYRKIETGDTKLSVERLFQIAETLGTKVTQLLEVEVKKVYQQEFNDQNHQGVQNLY